MRGMRGIAEQDDVPVAPLAADDAREVDPRRAANMAGIGHQLMAAQMIGEDLFAQAAAFRSEEHTSELQSLMRISYAVFCLKKKKSQNNLLQHKKYKNINELSTQRITSI